MVWYVGKILILFHPGYFWSLQLPGEDLFDPPFNFKTTKAIDTKLIDGYTNRLKMDNYKKFQFDLFL